MAYSRRVLRLATGAGDKASPWLAALLPVSPGASAAHGGGRRRLLSLRHLRTIQYRRRALLSSLLLHGLGLAIVGVLPARPPTPVAPSDASVAMVFATPSPPPEVTAPKAPPQQSVAAPSPEPAPATPEPDLQQAVESPKLPPPVLLQRPVQSRPVAHASRPAVPQPAVPPSAASAPTAAAPAPLIPARPVAGMDADRPPAYPELARRRGEQGRVLLQVAVSADGLPTTVTVAQSSGFPSLDTAAVNAVEKWRFIPATHAGAPTAATAEVPVRFRLVD